MKIKVYVKTPKNQAEKCIESLKKTLIGFKKEHEVIEQNIISHNEFYWLLNIKDEKELEALGKRTAISEAIIKQFYRSLLKFLDRANALANRFNKGLGWVRRWLISRLEKKFKDSEQLEQIKKMSDEDFKEFIKVTDREDIMRLISNEIIKIEVINEKI